MKKNRVYAGIDLDALRYNMESMHKNIKEGTKIAAVIKADAYGHGALTVAKTIEDLPYVWGFAVATADEAEMLIADGRKKPILILGISFPEHYELIVEKEIRPAICEYEAAKALSDIAVRKNKTCHIHIKIDTGMSRIGLQVTEESADLVAKIAQLPGIEIEGIFTHFAQADEYDKTPTKKQIALFQKMIAMAKSSDHPVDAILVWKFSRFARNQEESIVYKSLLKKKHNVDVISVSEPLVDGPFGSLIERIIEWMDEYYSVRLSGEVTRGMTEKAKRGGYQARPPLGYRITERGKPPVIIEDEAEIVRIIFRKYAEEGMGIFDIARYLNLCG